MGIDVLRSQIIERIQNADESFLRILDAMTAAYEVEQEKEVYQIGGQNVDITELKAKVARAEEQIDRGEYLTVEQLHQESELWLQGTK